MRNEVATLPLRPVQSRETFLVKRPLDFRNCAIPEKLIPMPIPLILSVVILVASDGPLYESELICPPEPMHSHGSTLVETPKGDLLAAWFYGRGEKGDDTLVIRGARKKKGRTEWSDPFVMADSQNLPDQNPVLFVDPRGTLWLFWICTQDNTYNTYVVKYRTSTKYCGAGVPEWDWQDILHCRPRDLDTLFLEDVAKNPQDYADYAATHTKYPSWLEDAKKAVQNKLSQRLGWMTRIHPIMLSDTRIMLPLYSDQFACSIAAFTDDWGKSWSFSQPILNLNVQACFVRKRNGDIVAMMRDRGAARRIPVSLSTDGGVSWSHVRKMDIPNPDSSVDCLALRSGHWVLVCNDTESGPRGGRNRLAVYLSHDEGATWKWKRTLEKHDESCAAAYPALIQARDGSIHCTYTYSPSPNETIKHVRFNEAWVRQGDR